MPSSNAAITLYDFHPAQEDVADEILEGLRRPEKLISPKFFYDERGSQLFDQITDLSDYYPTRTEIGIMHTHIAEMVRLIGPKASLIEFGSGSSLKTHILLKNLKDLAAYVPVEISLQHLMEAARELSRQYPHIEILPVCADFTQAFDLPNPKVMPIKNVVYFPGSTIGNFDPPAAKDLLEVMRLEAKEGGALLIGVDLKKDTATLENAYNDAAGVTAEFNLNVLERINRECGANFDLNSFAHRAIYNEEEGRIEMNLVSLKNQSVSIAGREVVFDEREHIVTEYSHKFSRQQFAELASEAGFKVVKVWTDPEELFSVQYLECD